MTAKITVMMLLFVAGITVHLTAQTVYITKTGERYHKEDCRYLHSSKIKTTLSDAKTSGYTPCKVCKPTTKVTKSKAVTGTKAEKQVEAPTKRSSTAIRCSATTKAGAQCKRKTTDSSGKCWQHR